MRKVYILFLPEVTGGVLLFYDFLKMMSVTDFCM